MTKGQLCSRYWSMGENKVLMVPFLKINGMLLVRPLYAAALRRAK